MMIRDEFTSGSSRTRTQGVGLEAGLAGWVDQSVGWLDFGYRRHKALKRGTRTQSTIIE